jgi:hypothetical protein
VAAHNLAKPPPDTIARHRATQRFFDAEAKATLGQFVGAKKTVKWELEQRFPARYTASNSPRLTSRASRGNVFPSFRMLPWVDGLPALFGGKPMASLFAACRQHLAAAFRLHARAESVCLRTAPPTRLKRALWQSNPPLKYAIASRSVSPAMRSRALLDGHLNPSLLRSHTCLD